MIGERDNRPPPPPAKPRRQKRSRRPRCTICPNCGTSIEINYCPNCGQHAADHNSSVWSFVIEFFDEFLQVDSKFFRTLGALVRKPGFLTQEWVSGKRIRYISPLKLYIVINALFFLVMTLKVASDRSDASFVHFNAVPPAQQKMIADRASRTGSVNDNIANFMVKRLSQADPELMRKQFLDHLSTASLLLIPIMALVFSLLYIRRERFYLEHLVFLLHVNSFCFVTLGIGLFIPWDWAIPLIFLWHCVYVFIAMKRNYAQGWIKTFVKFWIFGIAFSFLVIAATAITAIASALMTPASKVPVKAVSQPETKAKP